MVVQSIHSLNTCDNRIATTTNTSNCIIDVSPSNTSTTHLMMVSGVSFNEDNQTSSNPNNNSGTAARRSSARIQKLNREKALLRLSRTEESLKVKPPPPSQQERVSRKTTTRVYQRKKLHHQPNAVEKTTSELNTKTESSAAAAVNVDVGIAMVKNLGLTENGAMGDKSMHAMVTETLRTFNKHYLHFVQEEEKRCGRVEVDRKTTKGSKSKKRDAPVDDAKRGSKRPDLKALTKKGDAPEDDAKRGSKRPDLKALTKASHL